MLTSARQRLTFSFKSRTHVLWPQQGSFHRDVTNGTSLSTSFTPVMETLSRRRLVVGLGNPGMHGSRHSVGMAVVGALATRLGVGDGWRGDKQVSGEVVVSEILDTQVVLLRPKLAMNVNGASVSQAARKYGIKPEDILLVHDDLDKPLGKIAFKNGGSAGGHNGVRSCSDRLRTDVMPRLRVGIGRPSDKALVPCYVLAQFSHEEREVLSGVLEQSVGLLLSRLAEVDAVSSPCVKQVKKDKNKGKKHRRHDPHITHSQLGFEPMTTDEKLPYLQ